MISHLADHKTSILSKILYSSCLYLAEQRYHFKMYLAYHLPNYDFPAGHCGAIEGDRNSFHPSMRSTILIGHQISYIYMNTSSIIVTLLKWPVRYVLIKEVIFIFKNNTILSSWKYIPTKNFCKVFFPFSSLVYPVINHTLVLQMLHHVVTFENVRSIFFFFGGVVTLFEHDVILYSYYTVCNILITMTHTHQTIICVVQ